MTDSTPHDADLSSLEQANAHTHEAADSVAQFAKSLSHDLNNFTTVIRSYSELLLQTLPDGIHRNDVAEIYRAADAMATYLQRVTHFTRVGSMRPTKQAVRPLLESAVSEFVEARDQAAVVLDRTVDARVEVDAQWCIDALREILRNARDAAPPPSQITVTMVALAIADRLGVQIEVRDHGAGFTPDTVHRAEQPFVSTKRSVRGAGFGLTLVQAFARSAHGVLHYDRVGGVTCVALWLPIVA